MPDTYKERFKKLPKLRDRSGPYVDYEPKHTEGYDSSAYPKGGLVTPVGRGTRVPGKPLDVDTTSASFKRGGPVRKTGMAKVHRGEYVLTRSRKKQLAKHL